MATSLSSSTNPRAGPLAGLKVLELGQLIAGPFAAKSLADFGAEVIKIEPPGAGDPLRKWRLLKDGTSVWWQVQSRNKRSLALDLKEPDGAGHRAAAGTRGRRADRELPARRAWKAGAWGPRRCWNSIRGLIVLRISGYGQTGPYRDRPGFGVVAEAMSGLRHLTGEPGRVPVRVGVSHRRHPGGAARRHRHPACPAPPPCRGGKGQVIDVALYEAVFNCMESLLPEYSAFGAVRGPAGSALPGIAPTQCLPVHGRRLCAHRRQRRQHLQAADGGHRAAGPRARSPARRQRRAGGTRGARLDAAIGEWAATPHRDTVLAELDKASVPAGRIYTVADIAADPHYQARGMIDQVTMDDGSALAVPGIVPKLSLTPGGHRRNAPALGQDTDAVLHELGITPAADRMRSRHAASSHGGTK